MLGLTNTDQIKCICFIWQTIEPSSTLFDKFIEEYFEDRYVQTKTLSLHISYSKV